MPSSSTAVGIPARVARQEGRRVDDLDQVHIPDPVAQEFARLENKINELSRELEAVKSSKSRGNSKKTKEQI